MKDNQVKRGKGAPSAGLVLPEEMLKGAADQPLLKWQDTKLFPATRDDAIFHGQREKGGSNHVFGMHDDMGDGRWGA